MERKDLITLSLSIAAFLLSIFATYRTEKKAREERQRTIRSQLTDVLGRLTDLQLDLAKLQLEAKNNREYFVAVNSVIAQQNGFLIDQAVYLSEQIPQLVTTYEVNTIAAANANAGNFIVAERYYQNAIKISPNALYKSLAVRSYAMFLFPQGRIKEARDQFRAAIDLLKGEDNAVRSTNGFSYQIWAQNELNFARSPERANEYFEKARNEYASIDVEFMRNMALENLDAARNQNIPPAPVKYNMAPTTAKKAEVMPE